MRSFRGLPVTVCPSDTSYCTYPSCECPISFRPMDDPDTMIEGTAQEKYEAGWLRIFGKQKGSCDLDYEAHAPNSGCRNWRPFP